VKKTTKTARVRKPRNRIRSLLVKEIKDEKVSPSSLCHQHQAMTLWELVEEKKTPISPSKPLSLCSHSMITYTPTPQSSLFKTVLTKMFGDRTYSFRISTALSLSSSGTGIINSVINNSTLASNPDFTALAGVFNEMFVVRHCVEYQPVSRYQYPVTGTSALSASSLPLGCAQLQHGQAAYTSLASMTENFAFKFVSTGDPFSYAWVNNEKPDMGNNFSTGAGAPSQGWTDVVDVGSVLGTTQYLTLAAPPALPVSQQIGVFLVEWEVLMRVRQ
jgi:hypothetical protein